jgi:cation transport protein ChaC
MKEGREQESGDLLWIFGYGSLVWKPPEGFHHVDETAGYIKGWERRFWQGSTDHRGLPGAPGLVATLLRADRLCSEEHRSLEKAEDAICWGKAYGYGEDEREQLLQYLDFREKNGYERTEVDVHRNDGEPIRGAGDGLENHT